MVQWVKMLAAQTSQWKESLWPPHINHSICVCTHIHLHLHMPCANNSKLKLLYFLKEHFTGWIKDIPKYTMLIKTGLVHMYLYVCVVYIYVVYSHVCACIPMHAEKTIRCPSLLISSEFPHDRASYWTWSSPFQLVWPTSNSQYPSSLSSLPQHWVYKYAAGPYLASYVSTEE